MAIYQSEWVFVGLAVDIGKAMKTAGFDWLFIDMELNTMDIDMTPNLCGGAMLVSYR